MTLVLLVLHKALNLSLGKILVLFLLLLPVMALLFKTASSSGRFFIYRQSVEMIMEKPLTGWGTHGFTAHYMQRQADYMKLHPNSKYAMLVDDTQHPLSEFLLAGVNGGCAALCIWLMALGGCFYYYKKHPSVTGFNGIQIIGCLILFCLFSYPLNYPFTWVMLLYAALCLRHKPISMSKTTNALFLRLACGLLLTVVHKTKYELAWYKLAKYASYHSPESYLKDYEALATHLGGNPQFLYNYAFVLNEAGKNKAALAQALSCRRLFNTYDVQLLLGDIYMELRKKPEALQAYQTAHWMIPSRIIPLYSIYRAYRTFNDTVHSRKTGACILRMPEKMKSSLSEEIKKEVAMELQEE